jgi:hypothetical protein
MAAGGVRGLQTLAFDLLLGKSDRALHWNRYAERGKGGNEIAREPLFPL